MPSTTARRLKQEELEADEAVIMAIRNMHDYAATAGMPTLQVLNTLQNSVQSHTEADFAAQNSAVAARSALIDAEWERHEIVMRTKALIIANYGRNSAQVQAIGLKRRIDRKRRTRRNTTPTP